jgi:hypothetical protein
MLAFKRSIAVALVLLLTACSSVQVAYNNAPAFLLYQMDSYLDLSDDQEAILKEQLVDLQNWHRKDALPAYADTLAQWAQTASKPHTFTAQEVLEKQALFQEALLTVGEASAYRLAPLVLTLSERQRARLQTRFDRANRDYAKENLQDPVRAQRERRQRIIERYEQWLGSLNTAQRNLISQWLASEPDTTQLWGQERVARQAALMHLLADAKTRPSAEQAAISLHDYFQSLSSYRISDLQAVRQERLESLATLTAAMLNQMDDRQRRHLSDKLRGWASDLQALSDRAS